MKVLQLGLFKNPELLLYIQYSLGILYIARLFWDLNFRELLPQAGKSQKKSTASTINSITHIRCNRDLVFHQFIFIRLPQTDAGAQETSSNALAFVSLPKTSSAMLYDLFLCAKPRAPAHARYTHTTLYLPFNFPPRLSQSSSYRECIDGV